MWGNISRKIVWPAFDAKPGAKQRRASKAADEWISADENAGPH